MRRIVWLTTVVVALAGTAACNSLLGNGVHTWDGGSERGSAGSSETGTGGRNNAAGAGGHGGATGGVGGVGGGSGSGGTGGVSSTGGGNGGNANTGGINGTGGSAGHGGAATGGTNGTGGSGGTGGQIATGGSTGGANHTGGAATGGAATGGAATGGAATGGASTGGAATGGAATGGAATGGAATGGNAATGGSPAVPSAGCSTTLDGLKALTTGGMSVASGLPTSTRLQITSGTGSREYIIDIPADYDPTHPYRLIFSWHQLGGSDTGIATGIYPANDGPNFNATNYAFFGLRREATAANQSAIFVAPQGGGGLPWDYNRDVVLFDDLLALIDANLCIDDGRVFTTGFSLGAIMSYALSLGRPAKLRGAVTMAAVNYNFTQPTNLHVPIAYMGTTGMSDTTCPWGTETKGGKACVVTHAQDNGCTIPATIPTATVGSKSYVCFDFAGCRAGYPVKVCTFDGGHTPAAVDNVTTSGDDGLNAFIPPLAWKFIAQF